MSIKLTKKEREAVEWLHHFSGQLLEGIPVEFEKPIINQLSKMGVDLNFVIHNEIKSLKRGKDAAFGWVITNAPWYIRGGVSKQYLPFQIKELKHEKPEK